MEPICTQEDLVNFLNDRQLVALNSHLYDDTTVIGFLQSSNALTENGDIALCAALVTLTASQFANHLNNFTDHLYKEVLTLPISLS